MENENIYLNIKKCQVIGKVSFQDRIAARLTILKIKWAIKFCRNKITGNRIKHRMGKIEKIRIYYCTYCKGYHLTKWSKRTYNNYFDVIYREGENKI